MQWKFVNQSPITTERSRSVECEETGKTGWISLRWVQGNVRAFGAVRAEIDTGDEPGPSGEVLDREPEIR